jgi:hypothetical protein
MKIMNFLRKLNTKNMGGYLVESFHFKHVVWSTVWLHKGLMVLCEWEQSTKSTLDGAVAFQTQSGIRLKKVILENLVDPDKML